MFLSLLSVARSYAGVDRRDEAATILRQLIADPAAPEEQKKLCREFLKALKR